MGANRVKSLIEDKVLKANILSRLNDIQVSGTKIKSDEIVSDAKINIRKDKTGHINLEINSEELIQSKMSILMLKDEIKLDIENLKI